MSGFNNLEVRDARGVVIGRTVPYSDAEIEAMLHWKARDLVQHILTLSRQLLAQDVKLNDLDLAANTYQHGVEMLHNEILVLTQDEVPAVSVSLSNEAHAAFVRLRTWARQYKAAGATDQG